MKPTRHLLDLVRSRASPDSLGLAEWNELLQLARRANLMSQLAEALDAGGRLERLPREVRPHLTSALVLSRHQRQAIGWEVMHIAQALDPLEIPVVLLKGAAYAAAGLAAARGRLFGDVDILVPEEKLGEVEAALMLRGWSTGSRDPYDLRYYREWMHELPPMVNRRRGTVIDVHHNILPRTARDTPDARRMLEASQRLPDSTMRVLEPCDLVIHSATHLFHEGELRNGLRDLLDLESLIAQFSGREPGFVSRLMARAADLGLEWPVRLAFRSMAIVLGVQFEGDAAAISAVPRSARERFIDLVFRKGFEPDHPACNDAGVALARAVVYLRGHALRMPPAMLVRHLGRKAMMRLYRNTTRTQF